MVFSKLGRSEANARSEIPKVGNGCFDMTPSHETLVKLGRSETNAVLKVLK